MTILIDEKDFPKYFFEVKDYKPQKGQVLAHWQAIADFTEGWVKRSVIELLHKEDGAKSAIKVMRNMVGCTEKDSYRVPLEMAKDLAGMTDEDVEKKEYKMHIEKFFWVEKDYIPDDPHWSCISLINRDDFWEKHIQCKTLPLVQRNDNLS